jgi:hypothetical protein
LSKHLLFLIMIILFIISGCTDPSTPPEPSPAAVPTSTVLPSPPTSVRATTEPATSLAPSSASSSGTDAPIPVKPDPILGEKRKEHSFKVSFENLGELEFITTEEKIDSRMRPHFYIKGETVTELMFELESPESYYTVSAVSFRDVSGDGKKDILVIADYVTGFGYMGAIPVSQVVIFKQTDSGFTRDSALEDKAQAGIPYRMVTVQDVLTGLNTAPEDSLIKAWMGLVSKEYASEGSNELAGSSLTIHSVSRDGVVFSLDAHYASTKEALEMGAVNIGTIKSGKAVPSYSDMIYKDGEFELSLYLISNTDIYVRDNGKPYFGLNVSANGIYSPK